MRTDVLSDEDQIRNLVSTWLAATKAGDVDTVLSSIAEDAVFLVPGQPVMTKTEFAAAARALAGPNAPKVEAWSDIQEIKIFGDGAYAWSKLSVAVTPPGAASAIKRAGHTSTIFRKHNGRWLLARDANLLAAESK
jgi:uncharacterized protein (TIGR02246 family)